MKKLISIFAISALGLCSLHANAGATNDMPAATDMSAATDTAAKTDTAATTDMPAATEMPADAGLKPGQAQKNQVPDSTKNGDFLEPQPDENGATQNTTGNDAKNSSMDKKMGKKHNNSNAKNINKSSRFKKEPAEGGSDVKTK